jgi:uncharacterized protein
MAERYRQILFTPSVRAAQGHYYGRGQVVDSASKIDPLTDEERLFIEARDSFYMATISENGWPYMQHRGGPVGFLRVVSDTQLAFADCGGNRQLLTTGNLAVNNRVALFLMDYARRERLKILGHARVEDARQHRELAAQLAGPAALQNVERLIFVDIVSFDWNCPKYITPRFTGDDVEKIIAPLNERIAELEAQLRRR